MFEWGKSPPCPVGGSPDPERGEGLALVGWFCWPCGWDSVGDNDETMRQRRLADVAGPHWPMPSETARLRHCSGYFHPIPSSCRFADVRTSSGWWRGVGGSEFPTPAHWHRPASLLALAPAGAGWQIFQARLTEWAPRGWRAVGAD